MTDSILTTRALTKCYGGVKVVDSVELTLRPGEIYGLVGRNGAGKTTIIRMVAGQAPVTSGEITLFGESTNTGLNRVRARTGAMIEIPSFYPYLSARENLEYYRRQRGIPGKQVVDEALTQVGLADTGKKKFKAFSLGMKQRLGLALALMNHPDFLLLDEPINGLDPEGIVEFRNIILNLNRERGTTILISSHILSELSNVATSYGFIDKGQMLEQISAAALHEKCRACLEITVDDPAKAAAALERELGTTAFEALPNGVLRLHEYLDAPQKVLLVLTQAGIAISNLENKSTDLEEYFLKLIGGEKNA